MKNRRKHFLAALRYPPDDDLILKAAQRINEEHVPASAPDDVALEVAIRIKSAEFWIKLGQPDQAIREIKSLPGRLQKHPSVFKAHLAAIRSTRALREHCATNNQV